MAGSLFDAAGAALAEVADDRVRARRLPDGPELRWREWEVELLGGDRGVLDRVEAVLLAAGARPSSTASKVGRVLATALRGAGGCGGPGCGRCPPAVPR